MSDPRPVLLVGTMLAQRFYLTKLVFYNVYIFIHFYGDSNTHIASLKFSFKSCGC